MSDPNYYAIIPATVRYDNDLSNSQKIMFGEITALSQKNGYCYASNSYFADLYNVDPSTVSKWIKGLQENGYIRLKYERDGKQVKSREIKPLMDGRGIEINQQGIEKTERGVLKKDQGGIEKTAKYNNTSNNTTRENNTREGFSKRLQNAEDKQALLDIWLSYRKKKGKHATNYEKDVILNQDWKDKPTDRIREAISYTVKNGWLSLQWPEQEQNSSPFRPDAIHL